MSELNLEEQSIFSVGQSGALTSQHRHHWSLSITYHSLQVPISFFFFFFYFFLKTCQNSALSTLVCHVYITVLVYRMMLGHVYIL